MISGYKLLKPLTNRGKNQFFSKLLYLRKKWKYSSNNN